MKHYTEIIKEVHPGRKSRKRTVPSKKLFTYNTTNATYTSDCFAYSKKLDHIEALLAKEKFLFNVPTLIISLFTGSGLFEYVVIRNFFKGFKNLKLITFDMVPPKGFLELNTHFTVIPPTRIFSYKTPQKLSIALRKINLKKKLQVIILTCQPQILFSNELNPQERDKVLYDFKVLITESLPRLSKFWYLFSPEKKRNLKQTLKDSVFYQHLKKNTKKKKKE